MGLINVDSNFVRRNWWFDVKLKLSVLWGIWLLTSGGVFSPIVPFPGFTIHVKESDTSNMSTLAASITSLLEGHGGELILFIIWHVNLPPLSLGVLVCGIMNTSWRVKSWVFPVSIPV